MSEHDYTTDEQATTEADVDALPTPEEDSPLPVTDTGSPAPQDTPAGDDTPGVPQVVAGDDGIERHLVGAAPALPTYDYPTPTGGNAALDSVPLVIAPPAVPTPHRGQVQSPVGLVPVRPRGPKPDWYRGPERDDAPVAVAAGSGMVISDAPAPVRVPLAKPGLVKVTSDHVRALSERVPVGNQNGPVPPADQGIPATPSLPVRTPATPAAPVGRTPLVPITPLATRTPSLSVTPPAPAPAHTPAPTPISEVTPPVERTPSLPVTAPSLPLAAPSLPVAAPSLPATPPAPAPVKVVTPSPAVLTDADTEVPDWAAIRPTDDADITLTPSLPAAPPLTATTTGDDVTGEVTAQGEGHLVAPETRSLPASPSASLPVTPQPVSQPVSLPVVRPTLPGARPKFTPVSRAQADEFDEDALDELEARLAAEADEGEGDEAYTVSEAASTLLGRPTLPVVRPTLATPVHMPEPTSKANLLPDVDTGHSFDDEEDDEDDFYDEAEEGTDAAAMSTSHRAVKPLGLKITDRDLVMLQFLTRYKYATYPQIAEYLGTSVNALRQRLPRMKKAGLITSDNGGPTSYLVWRPTDTGVKLSGFDMRAPSLSWGAVNHTLGLVDLGIRFEKKEVVVTEREIRAADSRDRPSDRMAAALAYHASTSVDSDEAPLYVVALGKGEAQYSHIPDMVLVRKPQPDGTPMSVAIELELVRKPPAQWRKVLLAYKRSNNIGGVMYFTHKKQIANGITKIAAELDMTDMVRVMPFVPADGSKIPMPDTPATAA